MTYYTNDYGDDGMRPIDFEEILQECRDHEAQMVDVTGDRDLAVGVHNSDAYDFEVWVDGGRFGLKARYFGDFEELRAETMKLYPDADWEEVGW